MLAFDTETTGLLRPGATELWLQPFIIEIYMAKLNDEFEIIDEFDQLIKPPVPISEEITGITGITNEMVEGSPSFIQIYPDLCDFVCGEEKIFAHNCTFDISMLENELARHDLVNKFPWPSEHICTVEASFPLENKRLTLAKLYKIATGRDIVDAHRARNDVVQMTECIEWLHSKELV